MKKEKTTKEKAEFSGSDKSEKSNKEKLIVSEELEDLDGKEEETSEGVHFFGKSDRNFYIIIAVIFGILILLVAGIYFLKHNQPRELTIDEYHDLNLKGELDPEKGYLYNGFSFVNMKGTWFTRFQANTTGQLYNVELRYGPLDVKDIPLKGDYNYILTFNSTFMTFDPLGQSLPHVALTAADLSSNMAGIFRVVPFAACTKNETRACSERPIVQCRPGVPVIYLKEDPVPMVKAEGTCLTIQGEGLDLIKSADRLLLAWYGIMP